jgi:ribosomal protein S18 acetylase RimI-like enzyme
MTVIKAGDGILDNPVWAALTGPHAGFAETGGAAARYEAGLTPFAALADDADPRAWADLAALIGPGASALLTGPALQAPADWEVLGEDEGVQLVDVAVKAEPDVEATLLGDADFADMLDLVTRTRPGPFLPRALELGAFLGIRRDGRLVAMAGERVRPPGWTEISAVCTDPDYRGQGLAARLVRAVAAGIRERGDTPMLHAAATNVGAIRLYEALGFELRTRTRFAMVKSPD